MKLHIFILFVFIQTLVALAPFKVTNLLLPEGKQVEYDIDVAKNEYFYKLQTPDGTVKHERGYLKKDSSGQASLVVEGGYEFIADNGLRYVVLYTADKNGYRPTIITSSTTIPTDGEHIAGIGIEYNEKDKELDPDLLCKLLGCGAF